MTMIGIDPHKATHTAVAIDDNEDVVDEFTLRASSRQVRRLREWADGFTKREWAVESANGLGYLVAQQLVAAGETVFDVPPMLASRVRVLGSGRSQKNHPNDARSIAIAALRSDRLAVVRSDDHTRVLRLLVKHHRTWPGCGRNMPAVSMRYWVSSIRAASRRRSVWARQTG